MNGRWTAADVQKALNKPSRGKYGAKKVQIDGIGFDSKREGARYVELKTMRDAGLITALECHPRYQIFIRGIFICDVVLDFVYWDCKKEETIFIDVKGQDNPLSKLKRRMVEAEYGITVEVVK